ncbi:MAG: ABC transporter substrate-binding protein [Candidatus Nanopelagicales bacterium]|jgi:polar amino acid transport system substrate-binding protein|nr:ABC transporter substrate-binding protein [Candidatus Nanopelagicales bacterium]
MKTSLRAAVASGAVILTLGIAGCGSDSTSDSDAAPTAGAGASSAPAIAKDEALAAQVPAEIAADGVLAIGTDASYAPNEFIDADGTTVIGFTADLAEALGQVLGLDAQMNNAPFDSLVEGVKNGKFELGMSSFTINPERQEQVDMVSYFNAGTSWAVPTGNPNGITPDDACGRRIAVQKATVQVDDITARAQACEQAGKEPITIQQYQLQSDATAAVVSGKDDAMLADSPIVAYAIAQTGDQLEPSGEIYDAAPYGVAVPKGQGDYTAAIQGAMQQLMDSGAYEQILSQWGVQAGAVTRAEVNPVQ